MKIIGTTHGLTINDDVINIEIKQLDKANDYEIRYNDLNRWDVVMYAHVCNLKHLTVPNVVNVLYCHANLISELNIPESVRVIHCDKNVKLNRLPEDIMMT